jgi:hypothetical protein
VGASGYGRCGGYEGFKAFSNRKGMLIKSNVAPAFALDLLSPPYARANLLMGISPYLSGVTQQKLTIMLSLIALAIVGLSVATFYYFRGVSNEGSDF